MNSIQGLGAMRGMGMEPGMRELTSEQQTTIAEILAKYDPENVTKEDAKAIFQSFRDAGITPVRGMKEAIEAAGFDAEELRSMGMGEGGMPLPPRGGRGGGQSINVDALKSLQEILAQYDLNNLTDTDKSSLFNQLEESGLLSLGSVVNLQS